MSDSAVEIPNYWTEIEKGIKETRQAIQEALGYIERQEDGPLTMHYALKEIANCLDVIESEASYVASNAQNLYALTLRLRTQRDEAVRQRNLLSAPDPDDEYTE